MKIKITYISHRGFSGHENLYPDIEILTAPAGTSLMLAIKEIQQDGFFLVRNQSRWISPSCILEIEEIPTKG